MEIYFDLVVMYHKVHPFATYACSRSICSWFTPKENAFAAIECTLFM